MYCPACKPYVGPYTGLPEGFFELFIKLALQGHPIEEFRNHPALRKQKIDYYDLEEEYKRRLSEKSDEKSAPKCEIEWFLDE